MPVSPNVLERLLLGRLQKGPAAILDLLGAASLRAVTVAREYDIFEALAAEAATPATLADRLGLDARAVGALLAFLAEAGYVTERNGRYENTRLTRRWILESTEGGMGAYFVFWDRQVLPFWAAQLGHALETGDPEQNFYAWLSDRPDGWAHAQAAFAETAEQTAAEVVAEVDVPTEGARLLDVGGGHGLYSARFCQAHPDLAATVFDDPDALGLARETIADNGLADRMRVQGGDFTTDDLGSEYDIALLFNVLHGEDDIESLFERVRAALAPGGRVVIMEQFDEDGRMNVQPAMLRLLDLAYLGMLGGGLPDESTTRDQLRSAGFGDIERIDLDSVRGVSLLVATAA